MCPKPYSIIPLNRENLFNSFDLIRVIGNPVFRTFVTSKKDGFAKFLPKYQLWRSSFSKKFCKVIFF